MNLGPLRWLWISMPQVFHSEKYGAAAGSKTVEELREIIEMAGTPFIVKGIMTVKGALKAKEAGAAAIIVSNHGGRVLDQCPATAEVLEEIATAVNGSMKILVDGGIRSGAVSLKPWPLEPMALSSPGPSSQLSTAEHRKASAPTLKKSAPSWWTR